MCYARQGVQLNLEDQAWKQVSYVDPLHTTDFVILAISSEIIKAISWVDPTLIMHGNYYYPKTRETRIIRLTTF